MKRLPQKKIDVIREGYEKGQSLKDLADIYGVSYSHLRKIRRDNNWVQFPPPPPPEEQVLDPLTEFAKVAMKPKISEQIQLEQSTQDSYDNSTWYSLLARAAVQTVFPGEDYAPTRKNVDEILKNTSNEGFKTINQLLTVLRSATLIEESRGRNIKNLLEAERLKEGNTDSRPTPVLNINFPAGFAYEAE